MATTKLVWVEPNRSEVSQKLNPTVEYLRDKIMNPASSKITNLSWPVLGLGLYREALKWPACSDVRQEGITRSHANVVPASAALAASSGPGPTTAEIKAKLAMESSIEMTVGGSAPCSALEKRGSCHTLLFHGKYAPQCLGNVWARPPPCVRQLFITSVGSSGSEYTSRRLNAAGFHFEHEMAREEKDVLVSWLSRTDAWHLVDGKWAGQQTGPTMDVDYFAPYFGYRPIAPGLKHHVGLSRCLYRYVLLQVREPLHVVSSLIALIPRSAGYYIMADQLLARSGAFDSPCELPILPAAITSHALSLQIASNRTGRAALVAYAMHHWWAWNTAALRAADDWYRVEDTNLTTICDLGGLDSETCERVDSNGRISNSSNHHGLWKADGMLPVTWEEACRADGAWARAAHTLATRLGYEYKGEAAFPECPPTVREVVPLQG